MLLLQLTDQSCNFNFFFRHNINKFDIILLDNFSSITNSDFVSGDFDDKKFMVTSIPTIQHYNRNGF